MKHLDIKLKIAMIIALLLLVAMTLLDMVMVFATQKFLVKCEKQKAIALVETIGARMATDGSGQGLQALLADSGVASGLWMNARQEATWIPGEGTAADGQLERVARTAMGQQRLETQTVGTTWGVFWRQDKYLMVAGPVYRENRMAGVAGVTVCLDTVFSQLRQVQKFIGGYLLINTVILTLLGVYRIYHLALRPIHKIIGRAEAFRPGDAEFLLEESGENELTRLSRAINRVFDLNRDDQAALRKTVARLEEAMARLKQAQQEVVRAEKLATVGRLSSGVAHEIGNPIGIVMGYLELIKQAVDEGDVETQDYIRRAEDEVGRIRSVIRQLLDYSRPTEERRQGISIHGLLEETLEMVRIQPLFTEISVDSRLDAKNDRVMADPDQLKQLFLNFILNAADAIKMNRPQVQGRICIRSGNEIENGPDGKGGREVIHVDFGDNGPGIPEPDLNRIFDPFFTTKPPGEGSGLGLWVSLLIAEAMGGTIKVHTRAGEGTRMVLVLPVAPADGAGKTGSLTNGT